MLHDDIYDHFMNRLARGLSRLDDMPETERQEVFDKHYAEHKDTDELVLQNVYNVQYRTIKERPPAFYFDFSKENTDEAFAPPELVTTAREFFDSGVLKLPFDSCTLIIKVAETANLMLTLYNDYSEDDCPGAVVQVMWQYSKGDMSRPVILDAARFTPSNEGKTKFDFLPGNYSQVSNKEVINTRLGDHAQMFSVGLTALLTMNMPHYKSEFIPPIEKLNKKREKNGKAPYSGYTKIYLRPDIQADLNRGSKIAGYAVRPHWRRGHIRTLASGARIPVKPCMVNWSGETNLEKNTYEVAV